MKGTRQPLSPYYQKLADILTIFWEYHKARLEAGTIAFGYEDGARGLRKYDGPRQTLLESAADSEFLGIPLIKFDILNPFMKAVLRSLRVSWYQFLQQDPDDSAFRDYSNDIRRLSGMREGDEALPFRDPYVTALLQEGYSGAHTGLQIPSSLDRVVPNGMHTGVIMGTQLIAVMNDYFKPALPLLVSRVLINDLHKMRAVLGEDAREPGIQAARMESYEGFDPTSPSLLEMNQLVAAGYGYAMGCPAGHMPTEETQQFLETATGHRTSLPMLVDFSKELHKEYERTIMEWWKGLNQEEQLQAQSQITEECYLLLTGKRWEALREQREARQQTEGNSHTTETRRRGPRKRK